MSFFDATPEWRPRPSRMTGDPAWLQQDGVIPGSAPAGLFLIRGDEIAVAVGSVHGYPNGFEFTVHARLRHDQFVWGASPLDTLADPRTSQHPDQVLRLGILYADGRRARTSSYRPVTAVDNHGELLVLLETGTGGTDHQWDGQFWVHPLPPDGPVTFIASWLLYGAGEHRAELDSSAIHKAAERAVTLWPEDPDSYANDRG